MDPFAEVAAVCSTIGVPKCGGRVPGLGFGARPSHVLGAYRSSTYEGGGASQSFEERMRQERWMREEQRLAEERERLEEQQRVAQQEKEEARQLLDEAKRRMDEAARRMDEAVRRMEEGGRRSPRS